MKILEELNEQQRTAVEFNNAPNMIVAGAGSGKTRVLTYKIAYLLKKGFEPSSILALTFTNKAAKEMKNRIIQLVGPKADEMWIGTFHSIFARILRVEAKKIGYEKNFSIYDREDSVSLVNSCLQALNISIDSMNASAIQHRISFLKNQMISPDEYSKHIASNLIEKKIAEIYVEYNKRLKENNSMDFDDLLIKPVELFNNHQRILSKYLSLIHI